MAHDPTAKPRALMLAVGVLAAVTAAPLVLTTPVAAATNTAATNSPTDTTYDFEIPRDGGTYAVGTPAPTNGTLGDMFPANESGYTVYSFNADTQEWAQVTDFEGTELGALSAVAVTTVNNSSADAITVTVPVDGSHDVPPTRDLAPGWNFVAAPRYDLVSTAFGAEQVAVAVDVFKHPAGLDEAPRTTMFGAQYIDGYGQSLASPFSGYFVYAEGESDLPGVIANAEDRETLNDQLELHLFDDDSDT